MKIHDIAEKDYTKLHGLYTQLIDAESDINDMIRVLKEVAGDAHYTLVGIFDDEDILRGTATLTKCLDLTGDARYYYNLENFVIDEAVRRQGYGAALIQYCEDYVKKNNGAYINLTSSVNRTGAHKFYEAMGYPSDYVKGFKKSFR